VQRSIADLRLDGLDHSFNELNVAGPLHQTSDREAAKTMGGEHGALSGTLFVPSLDTKQKAEALRHDDGY
jgi:hypothetical protein